MLDRVRRSQYGIPILIIVCGVLLAVGTNILDDDGALRGSNLVLPTTRSAAQTLLSTVATSTITVAAIVFSVTAVVSQLSASQYSPRVLQGFLDDRYQQAVLGLVAGTFSFALVGQALISGEPGEVGGNITATTGVVLGVVSVVAIIGFIGRVTVRVRVDDTIARIADETSRAMRRRFASGTQSAVADDSWSLSPQTSRAIVWAREEGWVSAIDTDGVMDLLPAGGRARIDVGIGERLTAGDRVATVWVTDGDTIPQVGEAFSQSVVSLRDDRAISWDPGFGFRQLVDIALRALSPGVNDPNTAGDVVQHLVEPLRIAITGSQPVRSARGPEGRIVYLPHTATWDDYFESSFRDIRLAMDHHPTVARALLSASASLAEGGDPAIQATVCAEIERILATVDTWGLDPADREAVVSVLGRFDVTRQLLDSDG